MNTLTQGQTYDLCYSWCSAECESMTHTHTADSLDDPAVQCESDWCPAGNEMQGACYVNFCRGGQPWVHSACTICDWPDASAIAETDFNAMCDTLWGMFYQEGGFGYCEDHGSSYSRPMCVATACGYDEFIQVYYATHEGCMSADEADENGRECAHGLGRVQCGQCAR